MTRIELANTRMLPIRPKVREGHSWAGKASLHGSILVFGAGGFISGQRLESVGPVGECLGMDLLGVRQSSMGARRRDVRKTTRHGLPSRCGVAPGSTDRRGRVPPTATRTRRGGATSTGASALPDRCKNLLFKFNSRRRASRLILRGIVTIPIYFHQAQRRKRRPLGASAWFWERGDLSRSPPSTARNDRSCIGCAGSACAACRPCT